jgi:ribosome maturation factor RimP
MKVRNFNSTEDTVVDLILPIADNLGFDLWDVCFEKEGATWYLRVFIDKEDGITIDDAEEMTRPVNEILDEKDPISQSYILEVGSPGLERKLRRNYQFEASIGMKVVYSKIHAAKGEEKEIVGILQKYDDENKTVTIDDVTLELEKAAYVKWYEEWEF